MFDASTLEVFIASTNDLREARDAVEDVLRDWNQTNAKTRQIMLKPIRWEKDTTPELGPGSFQAVINKRLLDPADILIGIFGKRLGSPTANAKAGTVEEIERFAQAKKPVLLYFSNEPFNLSEIDPEELARVNEFQKSMQERGLYLTFKDLGDLRVKLRNNLDVVLQVFKALLIPAGQALAYGYFLNFVERANAMLRGGEVNLPGYKSLKSISFEKFKIRIAKPATLDDFTDNAAFVFNNRHRQINISTISERRAFRVFVPLAIYEQLERAEHGTPPLEKLHLDELIVIDFPTPMIAVNNFVQYLEGSILRSSKTSAEASGYWEKQIRTQYNIYFTELEGYIEQAKIARESIEFVEPASGAIAKRPGSRARQAGARRLKRP